VKVLAIETATAWQSVALLDDDRVLARHDQDAAGSHGMRLLPAIDRLLSHAGLALADVDGLACSIGPGSFTGIRVGVATCLGFRAAIDMPLVLVPTLEAMAWNVKGASIPVCPVLISRKGEVYWAVFRWTDGRLERLVAEQVGPPQALGRTIMEETLLFGEGWAMMEQDIRRAVSPSAVLVAGPDEAAKPSAVSIGLSGMERLQRGAVAGELVVPLYVQRAEAEIQYEQSGGISPVVRRQERVARKTVDRLTRGRRMVTQTGKARKSNG
jgi:tRNA threonylcarbamoyladenosine biosynthesis protein TsaB